jgi:hypothetical protein
MARRHLSRVGLLALALLLPLASAHAQQDKRAQTGMKFVSLSLDARGAALGDAMTAMEGGSAQLLYNPAGIARQTSFIDIAAGQVEWIADINYNQATVTLAPRGGRFGVIGFSVISVDYGTFEETIFDASSDKGFIELGTFGVTATAFGLGYARALTDRFSAGGHVKYVYQNLGEGHVVGQDFRDLLDENGNTIPLLNGDGNPRLDEDGNPLLEQEAFYTVADFNEGVVAYDFGVLYKTGFESLNFAFTARNFAPEVSYQEESFQLPLTLKIGVSMDLIDLTSLNPSVHTLLFAFDAEKPRDFDEQVKFGTEYTFMNTLALRAGYTYPTDEQGITVGAGIKQSVRGFGFGADYAYTSFGIFENVHRLSLSLSL